jgi:hypothetical protein
MPGANCVTHERFLNVLPLAGVSLAGDVTVSAYGVVKFVLPYRMA